MRLLWKWIKRNIDLLYDHTNLPTYQPMTMAMRAAQCTPWRRSLQAEPRRPPPQASSYETLDERQRHPHRTPFRAPQRVFSIESVAEQHWLALCACARGLGVARDLVGELSHQDVAVVLFDHGHARVHVPCQLMNVQATACHRPAYRIHSMIGI